jgi:hypothetical protein
MQLFLDDRNEDVDRDGNPDLGLHCILGCAVECFDAQVLFDPFEEQFDLPARPIQVRDGQRWFGKVVGQKDQFLVGLRIAS